jgi:energy-coupling factor transporter ATP-binding protein EcfA2/SAM-dependent methyltransferase
VIRQLCFLEETLHLFGLAPKAQTMTGLGRLVVLAGRNGAGKTRYLHVLQQVVNSAQNTFSQKTQLEKIIDQDKQQSIEHRTSQRAIKALETWRVRLADLKESRAFYEMKQLDATDLRLERFVTLTYQLAKAQIQLTNAIPPNAASQLTKENINPGFASAHGSMHAYFVHVARALWSAEDPRIKADPNVIRNAADGADFGRILDLLVGGRLEPVQDDNQNITAQFRGRLFNPAELSDGEAVLVTWAIILHRQKASLANSIVLIDEPENHLHPDACIKALRVLRDQLLVPHGQIWLATHSVQLIAFAGMDAVWLVDAGRVEYAGNKVDRVVERLLGGEEGRDQLRAFLADADALGFYNFVAECLVEPSVVAAKPGDPQEAQLVGLVQARSDSGEPLHLLDFGAGKGRLAAALSQKLTQRNDGAAAVNICYYAYNGTTSPPSEVDECRARVADLGKVSGVQATYVEDLRTLQLETSPKMTLVVLCNVLHEIRVESWLSLFKDIHSVLRADGTLLLMEDQQMRVGELPTAHGFVVLDAIEVAALFGARLGDEVRELQAAHGGRLTQIEISARVLPNANAARLKEALGHVQFRARHKVAELRAKNESSFQAGRLHAYYSMLFVNAMLAQATYG